MPKEIMSEEEFNEVAKRALSYRVKAGKNYTKVKLRTNKYLYTFKTDPDTATRLTKNLEIVKDEI